MGRIWFGDAYEVGAVSSRPVQSVFGLPPVQAEYSSLEICIKSPMMGFGGFKGAYTMLAGAAGGTVALVLDGVVIVGGVLLLINGVGLGEP